MFACSYGLSQLFQSVLRAYLRAGPTVLRARKPYSRIAAISEAFKIVNSNVLEAEQSKQLQAIRAHLDRLEDGGSQVIDV